MNRVKQHKYAIEDVVPHDHPMILIDELISYDLENACCQVTMHEKSNFFNAERNSVPSYVGIEYMAQSIAAFANANEKDQGREVSIGFLVSSRKFKILVSEFTPGMKLQIYVTQIYAESGGLSAFDCYIEHKGELVSSAKINTFHPKDASAFLAQ